VGTVRRVCRNVKRWRSAFMALRWTAAAMQEAVKGFRRLKAHKQLPALRAALEARQTNNSTRGVLARQANAAYNINFGSDRFAMFNKQRDISAALTANALISPPFNNANAKITFTVPITPR
jgi:hypothetical protein